MRSALMPLFLLLLSSACSSDRSSIDKRLAELGEEIRRLQSKNDALATRVDGLEGKVQASAARPSADAKEPLAARPALRVVKLVPGEEGASLASPESEVLPDERPDAPGQRPVIRLRGREGRDSSDAVARQSSEESR